MFAQSLSNGTEWSISLQP